MIVVCVILELLIVVIGEFECVGKFRVSKFESVGYMCSFVFLVKVNVLGDFGFF